MACWDGTVWYGMVVFVGVMWCRFAHEAANVCEVTFELSVASPSVYTIYGCTQKHNTCEVAKVILCSLFATSACLCKEQLGAISPFLILSIIDAACPANFLQEMGLTWGTWLDFIESWTWVPFQAPCQVAGFHSWFGACQFASQREKIQKVCKNSQAATTVRL